MQPKEDEFGVHRIKVGDTTVRFVEQMNAVQMTVEGELPAETLEELTGDLLKKISALENAPCELIKL